MDKGASALTQVYSLSSRNNAAVNSKLQTRLPTRRDVPSPEIALERRFQRSRCNRWHRDCMAGISLFPLTVAYVLQGTTALGIRHQE